MQKEELDYKYNYTIKKRAEKYLDKLPNNYFKLIMNCIRELRMNPYKDGTVTVKGFPGRNIRRAKVSDFRIIYEIFEDILIFDVIRIANKGDVYNHLDDLKK
jgi:mRNA interferase RelE/StbE